MVLIYQPPNAHVRISGILPSNAMAAAAVKKIYTPLTNHSDTEIISIIAAKNLQDFFLNKTYDSWMISLLPISGMRP
jgi:hypothetical protein